MSRRDLFKGLAAAARESEKQQRHEYSLGLAADILELQFPTLPREHSLRIAANVVRAYNSGMKETT